jgi:hypothetical protein
MDRSPSSFQTCMIPITYNSVIVSCVSERVVSSTCSKQTTLSGKIIENPLGKLVTRPRSRALRPRPALCILGCRMPRSKVIDAKHLFPGPRLQDEKESDEPPSKEVVMLANQHGWIFENEVGFLHRARKYRKTLSDGQRTWIRKINRRIRMRLVVRPHYPGYGVRPQGPRPTPTPPGMTIEELFGRRRLWVVPTRPEEPPMSA